MKDSEILKAARQIIKEGKKRFICMAIASVVSDAKSKQAIALYAWIQHMLGDYSYYDTWLKFNHPDVYNDDRAYLSYFREARLAWLDWMIAYCEEEEANGNHS